MKAMRDFFKYGVFLKRYECGKIVNRHSINSSRIDSLLSTFFSHTDSENNCQSGISCNQSNFETRRCDARPPHLVHNNAALSFWRSDVEILKQRNQEEKNLLTCKLFTKTRTFPCNIHCSLTIHKLSGPWSV